MQKMAASIGLLKFLAKNLALTGG